MKVKIALKGAIDAKVTMDGYGPEDHAKMLQVLEEINARHEQEEGECS